MSSITKSQIFGIIFSIFILITMSFIPTNELLTEAGRNSLGILIVTIVLLITEPIPMGVTCIFSVALMVLFKAAPNLLTALSGYSNPTIFFVLASFGISLSITKTPLSTRLLKKLMETFGVNVKMILLSIMVCAAILSSLVSNVATTAIFIPIVLGFLNIFENEDDKKSAGKTMMIGLPIAGIMGGMMTPAGTSNNLMIMNLLEQLTGIRITFVQWMFYGIPVAVIMIPIAWYIIIKVYKPAELSKEDIQSYIKTLEVPKKLDFKEKYVLVLITVLLTLWILSSWIRAFDVILIAIIGFTFLFIPKISIITWKEYLNEVSWDAVLLIGTVISIGNNLVKNGVSEWIAKAILPGSMDLPIYAIVFIVCIIIYLMLIVVPVAPATIAVLLSPLVGLAGNIGINPAILAVTLGLVVVNCYLLPLDTVPLLTYMTGYYKMTDMPKSTILIQLLLAVVVAIWIPFASQIMGIL